MNTFTHKDSFLLWRAAVVSALLSTCVLVGHAIFYQLSDLTSASNSDSTAWAWLIAYHLIANVPLVIAALLASRTTAGGEIKQASSSVETISTQFGWLLLIAVIGLMLHWDAKLRLIDYSFNGCWAGLRGAWLNQVRDGPVIYRVESVLGHLLSSCAYLGLFASSRMLVARDFTKRNLFYFVVFSVIGFLYALAIVSRSVMMVLMVIAVLACLFAYLTSPITTVTWIRRSSLVIGIYTVVSFVLAMSIFSNTINCTYSDTSVQEVELAAGAGGTSGKTMTRSDMARAYEDGFLDEVPVKRKANPDIIQNLTREYCASCNTVFIYLNHGIFNFAELINKTERGEHVLFRFADSWARRLALLPPKKDGPVRERVYGRGGATLPGSAYHDYGAIGVVLTALGQGAILLGTVYLLRRRGIIELFGVTLFVAVGLTTAFSGMFVAPSLISFPFVIFSVLVWGGVALLISKYKSSKEATRKALMQVEGVHGR